MGRFLFMTFDRFQSIYASARAAGHDRVIIPVARRISGDLLTPVSALLRLRQGARHAFLFESVEGGEKLARYSFLSRNPYLSVEGRDYRVAISDGSEGRFSLPDESSDIFSALHHILGQYHEVTVPHLPRLTGGGVGFFGYDCVRLIEKLDRRVSGDGLPNAVWHFYDTIAAFDHVKHQLVLISQAFIGPEASPESAYPDALSRLQEFEMALCSADPGSMGSLTIGDELPEEFGRESFSAAVDKARHYIREGDIFQVVLSRRREFEVKGDAIQLYRALRQVNPSPYLFYVEAGDATLIGSSPEVLVRAENGVAELLPIAGTRHRDEDPEADARLEEDLLADPKERAEHLMLVDLGRNDLGRTCDFGSVKVDRYAFIERYSHVMHIVSSVSGRLRDDMTAVDLLASCFPAGTVSGAPKVRAMQIIDELEPTSRGAYSGAVGYFDFKGDMDTCIAIRTMVVQDGRLRLQAGAGIVADSDPEREYIETENKMAALRAAVRLAQNDLRLPSFGEDASEQNTDIAPPFESVSENTPRP
jgi:anthranilate synthase component I